MLVIHHNRTSVIVRFSLLSESRQKKGNNHPPPLHRQKWKCGKFNPRKKQRYGFLFYWNSTAVLFFFFAPFYMYCSYQWKYCLLVSIACSEHHLLRHLLKDWSVPEIDRLEKGLKFKRFLGEDENYVLSNESISFHFRSFVLSRWILVIFARRNCE